jgi:methionine transaminase
MLRTTSKLPDIPTSIFSVMSALASEHQAVNLSQGFPGFPIDPHLSELVTYHMHGGKNQYAPMPGVPVLREALADKIQKLYGRSVDANQQITITAGATQAIFTTISALVHPGDEVILFSPAYDCYGPTIQLAGGRCVYIPLDKNDYAIPWEEVRRQVNDHTRMIIINSPHNPSGAVLSSADLDALEDVVEGTNIVVLSDEVYEHVIFDGRQHYSCLAREALVHRCMCVFSFGKVFHATGWKMGYVVGPTALMTEFRKVHQFNVFSVNTPIQYALADYLMNPDHYQGLGVFYQEKRDYFLHKLAGSRFDFSPAAGTYFQLLNFKKISNKADTELATLWTKKHKIATIPVSAFYPDGEDNHVLRVCFAKDNETLDQAAEILCRL